MSKIAINNSFNGGLITDLSVFNTPLDSVIDSLNMELMTIGDNQYLYQNIKGNSTFTDIDGNIVDLGTYTDASGITYKFIPLGMKVYDDIAYILAGAFNKAGDFLSGTVGTFPSPDWDVLNAGGQSKLYKQFSPLNNFKKNVDIEGKYSDPFISTLFKFSKNEFIDVVIQGDFDRSANIIFTDGTTTMKIINSRFKSTDIYGVVNLADRRGNKDSNIYSDSDWDRIDLIQISDTPINVVGFTITEEGSLRGGGYKYFFKYVTQEGNTTDILYESPLIPISDGVLGLNKNQISNKLVSFELNGLDSSYMGVQVYFAHFDGNPEAVTEYFKINYVFTYSNNEVTIKHSGLESVTPVDIKEIDTTFSPIDTIQSADIINDRIALAGIKSTLLEEDITTLEEASKTITLWEVSKEVTKSYSDPNTAAKDLGYWPGEVYEFAVVYLLKNKGLSPAFPVTGMDNLIGLQFDLPFMQGYPEHTIGEDGFSEDSLLINNKGIFRISEDGDIYIPRCGEEGSRYIKYIKADTSQLSSFPGMSNLVTGFFIVRRERIKNVLMQGMAVPTIKLPSKKPSISPITEADTGVSDLANFIGNKRYLLKHYAKDNPTLGLNTKYESLIELGKDILFDAGFSTVFVPQPTQVLNILAHDKAYTITGSIGQVVGDDLFGETINRKGELGGIQYLSFYSCEIDLNLPRINNMLTGSSPSIEIQKTKDGESPVAEAIFDFYSDDSKDSFKEISSNIIIKNVQKISNIKDSYIKIPSVSLKSTLISSGSEITADNSFTGKTDRALGVLGAEQVPYHIFLNRTNDVDYEGINLLSPTSRHNYDSNGVDFYFTDNSFKPYSVISQSYSVYLGLKIDIKNLPEIPTFSYRGTITNSKENLANGADILNCSQDINKYYVNVGHLSNIFRTPEGRWKEDDIRNIYKFDNNKAYFSSTDRKKLDSVEIDILQVDAFISKIFKRITYKNGVGLLSASAGDAGTFGTGPNKNLRSEFDLDITLDAYLKDEGRNLYDVGQLLEIVTYSNINADIRSIEFVSEEETKAIGFDRDFYPHKDESILGDSRPDSTMYNQGYSPDNHVVSYFRIEENAAVFSTEFPNRIMLSEQNQVQEFYNAFRDLRGFNFRDYGLEYGPIVKIITVNSILLSIHRKGILAIGVDDRTLLAEGSDIYVDTARALSPKAAIISDLYGTDHPESIVKSDTTVLGVDYNADAVWMYAGGKIKIISEFAVKTLLNIFKEKIIAGKFEGEDDDKIYVPRIYSTFNYIKHTLYVSYVAEHPTTKKQYHVGTVTYNTIIDKWMSRISEGNKFLIRVTSDEYSFGFSEINNIWEEDSLKDGETGEYIRSSIRGVTYNTEFEIIINDKPTYEKILENIIVLCNKRIPAELIFTTSGDVNDPAIDIWGTPAEEKTTSQPIKTRGDSSRKSLGIGILDQNAYYKDSKLFIEVGKVGFSRKDANNKRIRDKHIKVRFIYKGNDELFIQAIISILSISQN